MFLTLGSLVKAQFLGIVGFLLITLTVLLRRIWIDVEYYYVSVIGLVIVAVAAKFISQMAGDKSIFRYMLIAVALYVIAVFPDIRLVLIEYFYSIYDHPTFPFFLLRIFIAAFITSSSIFLMMSFLKMARSLGAHAIKVAGIIYFVNAVLASVLGIGTYLRDGTLFPSIYFSTSYLWIFLVLEVGTFILEFITPVVSAFAFYLIPKQVSTGLKT